MRRAGSGAHRPSLIPYKIGSTSICVEFGSRDRGPPESPFPPAPPPTGAPARRPPASRRRSDAQPCCGAVIRRCPDWACSYGQCQSPRVRRGPYTRIASCPPLLLDPVPKPADPEYGPKASGRPPVPLPSDKESGSRTHRHTSDLPCRDADTILHTVHIWIVRGGGVSRVPTISLARTFSLRSSSTPQVRPKTGFTSRFGL